MSFFFISGIDLGTHFCSFRVPPLEVWVVKKSPTCYQTSMRKLASKKVGSEDVHEGGKGGGSLPTGGSEEKKKGINKGREKGRRENQKKGRCSTRPDPAGRRIYVSSIIRHVGSIEHQIPGICFQFVADVVCRYGCVHDSSAAAGLASRCGSKVL